MEESKPEEKETTTDITIYVSVEKHKLLQALQMNDFLRKQNEELKADIASLFIPSTFVMKKLGSSSNPLKMVTFFTDLVMHPDKYKPIMRPFKTILKKYDDVRQQVEEMMEKTIKEMDDKKKLK